MPALLSANDDEDDSLTLTNSIYRGNSVIRIAKESVWKLANSSFTEIPLQRRIAEEKDKIFTSCAAFRGEGEEERDQVVIGTITRSIG